MERLPTEILQMVAEQLLSADLKTLSLASKRIRGAAIRYLQNLITIRSANERELYDIATHDIPDSRIRRASELRFAAPFHFVHEDRCPHPDSDDEEDDSGSETQESDVSEISDFGHLIQRACSFVDKFEKNKLRSFSWDMGCCVPEAILGEGGIIACKHPLLESLRLITDPTCCFRNIDLSAFRNLKSICWKGPHNNDHHLIDTAIKNNAHHLESLELVLLYWWKKSPDEDTYDRRHEGDDDNPAYFGNTLKLHEHATQPIFQTLTSLVLAHAPLGPAMVDMINFEVLRSLTLRLCPGWGAFTQRIVKMGLPVKLKTLELHHDLSIPVDNLPFEVEEWLDQFGSIISQAQPGQPGQSEVEEFVDVCGGLKELFLNLPEPVDARSLWKHITLHKASLKRLVLHHTRDRNYTWTSGADIDLLNLGLADKGDTLYYPPSPNPLQELKLECIGLCCYPELAELMLETSWSLPSLRFIHIRSTGTHLKPFRNPASHFYDPQIPSPLLWFAEWAFGPDGPPLLEAIAYGDFAHEGRADTQNLILCPTGDWFQTLDRNDDKWRITVEKYRNVLESCPMKPILEVDDLDS